MSDIYLALVDENRRQILDSLAARDGQTQFELFDQLPGLSPRDVTEHIEVLRAASLVIVEQRGPTRFHTFNRKPLAAITRRWPPRDNDHF